MGAIGAAILARLSMREERESAFRGFALSELEFEAHTFTCDGCPNICEVVNLSLDGLLLARWGGRCGKWEDLNTEEQGGQASLINN
jgi:hypothetical protein